MDIGLKIRRNPNFHYIRYDPLRPTEELTQPYAKNTLLLPLKLCKLKKNHIFSHYFLREKARQFGNMTRLCIQGLDNFYIPSFASKLLLKEVICKKKHQKRLFSTESSTYRDFSHLNAYEPVRGSKSVTRRFSEWQFVECWLSDIFGFTADWATLLSKLFFWVA